MIKDMLNKSAEDALAGKSEIKSKKKGSKQITDEQIAKNLNIIGDDDRLSRLSDYETDALPNHTSSMRNMSLNNKTIDLGQSKQHLSSKKQRHKNEKQPSSSK